MIYSNIQQIIISNKERRVGEERRKEGEVNGPEGQRGREVRDRTREHVVAGRKGRESKYRHRGSRGVERRTARGM